VSITLFDASCPGITVIPVPILLVAEFGPVVCTDPLQMACIPVVIHGSVHLIGTWVSRLLGKSAAHR
jgi:hypothetical protein